MLHGNPLIVLSAGGPGPRRQGAWTVVRYGAADGDVLDTLAHRGIDLRAMMAARLDSCDLPGGVSRPAGGRSSYPLGWEGTHAAAARAALANPLPGQHVVGTSLVLGPGIPYVAWQAAHVADRIGKA